MPYTPQDRAAIFKKIHASPGMQVFGRKKQRSFFLNIFVMNKIELQNDLTITSDPTVGLQLMSEEYREAGRQVHREVNRRFHNFLAAAKTLIDHTRVFMSDHYDKTDLHARYLERVERDFAEDELCRFMQDLRNYTLHYELPISTMNFQYSRDGGIKTGVYIINKELQKWKNWSRLGAAYLQKQQKEISPLSTVNDYSEKIEPFHSWLDTTIHLYHSDDMAEFIALQEEFIRINAALSPDLTPKQDEQITGL
jgi:hypothetical protein